MMKRLFVTVIFCLAFTCSGLAQDNSAAAPATKEDVERYFQVIHSHDMIQNMIAAMSKPMHQSVHDQFMKDKDKLPPDFESRMNKIMDDMMKDMPFDEMMAAMVPTYQKHFTKGDIDALVSFYSTQTGQKVLREMPAIMGESMQTMMPIMRQHMDEINQRVQQAVTDMLKDSQKKPAPNSAGT
jgi:hypothetical protein